MAENQQNAPEQQPQIACVQQEVPKKKKPIYKRVWFWLLIAVAFIIVIAASSGDGGTSTESESETEAAAQAVENEKPNESVAAANGQTITTLKEKAIPAEYASALIKAKTYSETMHMSKKGLYAQLTSEYGEKFSAEAAQYAVDHVNADWKANALASAKNYQSTMAMSPAAIRDQLVSEYGEKFTEEEAEYAIAHLND
jgi:hypothetical protein